jgi:hypothetical protein
MEASHTSMVLLSKSRPKKGGLAMTNLTAMPENYDNIQNRKVEPLKAACSASARNVNSIRQHPTGRLAARIVTLEQGGSMQNTASN